MKSLWLVPLVALAAACATLDPPEGSTVFHNGAIYRDAFSDPVGLLVAGPDGRVLATADALDAARLEEFRSAGLLLVDLQGGTAIPGLQDAHGHISGLGSALEEVDLNGADSYAEVVERIAKRAAQVPEGTWVTGRGWDQTRWKENVFPTHDALSEAVPEHPVHVRRVDGHASLANRRALELAGLFDAEEVPVLEGGKVVVDEDGRATGVLVDTAMGLVDLHMPSKSREVLERRILLAQEALLAEGLVCVHDMGVTPDEAEVYADLAAADRIDLRVLSYIYGNGGIDAATAARPLGLSAMTTRITPL